MVQPVGEFAQDFPFLGGVGVVGGGRVGGGGGGGAGGGGVGVVVVVVAGFVGAGHVGAPDGVDAEVFVEDHEEVVEPALAEAFVSELGVGIVGGGGGGILGRSGMSSGDGYGMEGKEGGSLARGSIGGGLTSSLPDLTSSDVIVWLGFSND